MPAATQPDYSKHPKIGLMTGTFDPPHQGHRSILEDAIASLQLDECFVLVNDTANHKPDANDFLRRQAMAQLMFGNTSRAIVADRLLQDAMAEGGVDSAVRCLCQSHAESQVYRIVGADSYLSIPPIVMQSLPANAHFAVYPRHEDEGQINELRQSENPNVTIMSRIEVTSSTHVRSRLRAGSPTRMISSAVQQFINHHKLYQVS
jgi:nicotinate-nucleotide adenylyltransferase